MRIHRLTAMLAAVFLSACIYDTPLVEEASLPIDLGLLGNWALIPEEPEDASSAAGLVIRWKSDTVYEIQYSEDQSITYFDGWLADLDGLRFVQLKVTGDDKGPVDDDDFKLFIVFSYELLNDRLMVRSLNSDLVQPDLIDTAAMQAAFTTNRDKPGLFHEPGQFRKL